MMLNTADSFELRRCIENTRALVRADCGLDGNRFGPSFFDEHLALVVRYGRALAGKLGANPDVVEIAGWLHDLAAVRNYETLPVHAHAGAALARNILGEMHAPKTLTDLVCACIETHMSPNHVEGATPEQICISNADVLSQIARPAYWLYYLCGVHAMSYPQAIAWLRERVGERWAALAAPAQLLGNGARELVLELVGAPTLELAGPPAVTGALAHLSQGETEVVAR